MLMKMRGLILLTALLIFSCTEAQQKKEGDRAIEVPWTALKLIAESAVDPCKICSKMKLSEATAILVRKYEVGRIIKSTPSCAFIRTDECGENEFVLSCYKKREPYTVPGGAGEVFFPLLVFRFHTVENHLEGISRNDFTPERISAVINESIEKIFRGEGRVIMYEKGDGPSFNIYEDKNRVVVNIIFLCYPWW